ncbi:transcription factor [Fusarium globosum]|uniref:Transcription factor n=1 Tax=Fusarium globosum TaxID=78864 RepID=A0A8H5YHG4_9HYPO|nr:transcription factor [Fusarium globosum]
MSTVNTQKTMLIFGATSKQGGAVIDNILSNSPDSSFNIITVTRDTSSRKAQALAANPKISVVEGDLDNVGAIFAKAGPVWGVYSVQINSDAEEQQGKAVINAAVQHGVQHFVYSSGDRGGPERSPNNPTYVKNFAAKYAIEKHLEQQARDSVQQMTYTILRPVTFFENITTDIHGKGFARMWEQMGSKKLQMVSTKDIGWFAAQSLIWPEMYKNMALTLVSDELTQREADAIYYEVIGQKMALAPCPVASAVKFVLKGSVGDMFKWFADEESLSLKAGKGVYGVQELINKLRCDSKEKFPDPCSRCNARHLFCTVDATFKRTPARKRLEAMSKELQELRNQTHRTEDQLVAGSSSASESRLPASQDEGVDDFELTSFTVSLGGVVIEPSTATEAFMVFAEYMRPRLPVVASLSAQAAYENQPFLFWTIVTIVLCRLPEPHSIPLFQLLRAPYERLVQETVTDAPLPLYKVQALLLLCNWPLPTDKQWKEPSWLYCGVAIQAARYLSLDRQQTIPSLRVIGVTSGSIRSRINTWLSCFSVSTSLSLHLGLPCPIESELDFAAIHAFLKRQTVPPAFAIEVRIQLVVAKFTALLNHELVDGTISSFLRLFDTELDAIKNEILPDEETKSIVEYAILDAKIHIYTLVITKSPANSSSRQILLRTARYIALRIVEIGTRAIRSNPTNTTFIRREKCQPKDRHRCLGFSTIFLLKFFIRQSSDSPEERQIAANHVAMTQTLCRACTIDPKDEFSRIVSVFEALGRESSNEEDKTKLVLNHRMGVSLMFDAVNTAGKIRGKPVEVEEGSGGMAGETTTEKEHGHGDMMSQVDGNPEFLKNFWSDPYTSLLQFDPTSLEGDYPNTW